MIATELTSWNSRCSVNNADEAYIIADAEKRLHELCDSFGPLTVLMCPKNEFGIEKPLPLSLGSTPVPLKSLYDYQSCAELIAQLITYKAQNPPDHYPSSVSSPQTTLDTRQGNSFEISLLLASLLLHSGYDVYCVCGKTEINHNAGRMGNIPADYKQQLRKVYKKLGFDAPSYELLYRLSLEGDTNPSGSIHANSMGKGTQIISKAAQGLDDKDKYSKEIREAIHCWVLLRKGGLRGIPEDILIEPVSGVACPLASGTSVKEVKFLWNESTYWVRTARERASQRASEQLVDFDTSGAFQSVINFEEHRLKYLQPEEKERSQKEKDQQDASFLKEFPIGMATSWCGSLDLSNIISIANEVSEPFHSDISMEKNARVHGGIIYADGSRIFEKFQFTSEASRIGLKSRVGTVSGMDSKISRISEKYSNRSDELLGRDIMASVPSITEFFDSGRSDSLKELRMSKSRFEATFYPFRSDQLTRLNIMIAPDALALKVKQWFQDSHEGKRSISSILKLQKKVEFLCFEDFRGWIVRNKLHFERSDNYERLAFQYGAINTREKPIVEGACKITIFPREGAIRVGFFNNKRKLLIPSWYLVKVPGANLELRADPNYAKYSTSPHNLSNETKIKLLLFKKNMLESYRNKQILQLLEIFQRRWEDLRTRIGEEKKGINGKLRQTPSQLEVPPSITSNIQDMPLQEDEKNNH